MKNFDEKKIYCSDDVHEALQGMKLFIPQSHDANIPDDRSYSILHHNVQGLCSKMTDIKSNKDMYNIDIIAITETWLHSGIESTVVELTDYTMFRQDRTEAKGGVLVYAANSVKCTEMNIESALEFCVVKVAKADLPPLAIATIYRSPNTPLRSYSTAPRFPAYAEKSRCGQYCGDW